MSFRNAGARQRRSFRRKKALKRFKFHGVLANSKFGDPYFGHFNMDMTEVTIGQFKKFNTAANYIIFV